MVSCIAGGTCGIGAAVSRRLLAAGGEVVAVGRDVAHANEIRASTAAAKAVRLTVLTEEAFAAEVAERGLALNLLVNAGGTISGGGIRHETFDVWQSVLYGIVTTGVDLFTKSLARAATTRLGVEIATQWRAQALSRDDTASSASGQTPSPAAQTRAALIQHSHSVEPCLPQQASQRARVEPVGLRPTRCRCHPGRRHSPVRLEDPPDLPTVASELHRHPMLRQQALRQRLEALRWAGGRRRAGDCRRRLRHRHQSFHRRGADPRQGDPGNRGSRWSKDSGCREARRREQLTASVMVSSCSSITFVTPSSHSPAGIEGMGESGMIAAPVEILNTVNLADDPPIFRQPRDEDVQHEREVDHALPAARTAGRISVPSSPSRTATQCATVL